MATSNGSSPGFTGSDASIAVLSVFITAAIALSSLEHLLSAVDIDQLPAHDRAGSAAQEARHGGDFPGLHAPAQRHVRYFRPRAAARLRRRIHLPRDDAVHVDLVRPQLLS